MQPESLTIEKSRKVACNCKEILIQFNILDVEVEIREFNLSPLVGPKLLMPVHSSDPMVDVRLPLTHTLGLPITG